MEHILNIPNNVDVKENSTSYYWFDEDGILCALNKNIKAVPYDEVVKLVEDLKHLTENKKICMLMDVTHSPSSTKEIREYTAREFPKLVKALALVSASPVSRLLAYLFFAVVRTPFPSKMFSNEGEAKAWLKQHYLN